MAITTQIFAWNDIGAPNLASAIGSLKAILDAVLIDGYNSKVITSAVRASNVVTVTSTAHGRLTGDWITSTGSSDASFNGDFLITVVNVDTYTYSNAGVDATATGTITHKKASAGWSRPYSASGATQCYRSPVIQRYIQHSGASALYDTITSYETMSSATAGTGVGTGRRVNKGVASCPYFIIAVDGGKMIHLFIDKTNGYATSFASCTWEYSFFGEFQSLIAGDTYNFVNGCASNNTGALDNIRAYRHGSTTKAFNVMRAKTQSGADPQCHWDVDWQACGPEADGGLLGYALRTYPDSNNNSVELRKGYIWEDAYARRGEIQGLYFPTQNMRASIGASKITATSGNLNGKVLLNMLLSVSGSYNIQIDITQ